MKFGTLKTEEDFKSAVNVAFKLAEGGNKNSQNIGLRLDREDEVKEYIESSKCQDLDEAAKQFVAVWGDPKLR